MSGERASWAGYDAFKRVAAQAAGQCSGLLLALFGQGMSQIPVGNDF